MESITAVLGGEVEIPTQIDIAGAVYRVTVGRVPQTGGQRFLGLSDHDKRRIWVSAALDQDTQQEVFWHEVMHCVNATLTDDVALSEAVVGRLALGMWCVIRQVYE